MGRSERIFWSVSFVIIIDGARLNSYLFNSYSPIHEIVRRDLAFRNLSGLTTLLPISHPRTAEEEEKTKNVMLKGHTGTCSCQIYSAKSHLSLSRT